jgi:hypothetical protein
MIQLAGFLFFRPFSPAPCALALLSFSTTPLFLFVQKEVRLFDEFRVFTGATAIVDTCL